MNHSEMQSWFEENKKEILSNREFLVHERNFPAHVFQEIEEGKFGPFLMSEYSAQIVDWIKGKNEQ